MFKNLLVRRAVRHALVANALVMACAATQAAEEPIAEIVVTGSRIARPDIEASTPVQVLSGQAIDMQGSQNISDILAELPAVGTPGLSRTNSNFLTASNGVSTVNLRNMQDQRTLVLINGRRVVAGVGGTSIVDVNNIPTDLIESVQVLTGGASAVYGSEAVAGVVNFILKDDYEGLNVRAQTGASGEGDAERHLFSITGGLNIGDRGNITGNVQYDRDFGLRSRNREISANDNPARSGLPPQGRFPLDGSDWTFGPDNVLKDTFVTAQDGFNRNAERYIAVPLERTLVTRAGQLPADRFHQAVRRRQLLEDGVELQSRAARHRQLRCGIAGRHDPAGPVARQSVHPGADPGGDGRDRGRDRRGSVPADDQAHERRVRPLEPERSRFLSRESSA